VGDEAAERDVEHAETESGSDTISSSESWDTTDGDSDSG
jgi:hypothetical protein